MMRQDAKADFARSMVTVPMLCVNRSTPTRVLLHVTPAAAVTFLTGCLFQETGRRNNFNAAFWG